MFSCSHFVTIETSERKDVMCPNSEDDVQLLYSRNVKVGAAVSGVHSCNSCYYLKRFGCWNVQKHHVPQTVRGCRSSFQPLPQTPFATDPPLASLHSWQLVYTIGS